MELIQLRCPNCGAELEIENGIDSFFCKYCGTKILLHGQSKDAIKSKTKLKMMDKVHEMQQTHYQQQLVKEEIKRKKAEQDRKNSMKALMIMLVVAAAFFIGIHFFDKSEENKSNAEVAKLTAIYEEIQQDIQDGNYTEARLKTNNLYYTSNYSGEIKKQWDNTRKELLKIIDEATDK